MRRLRRKPHCRLARSNPISRAAAQGCGRFCPPPSAASRPAQDRSQYLLASGAPGRSHPPPPLTRPYGAADRHAGNAATRYSQPDGATMGRSCRVCEVDQAAARPAGRPPAPDRRQGRHHRNCAASDFATRIAAAAQVLQSLPHRLPVHILQAPLQTIAQMARRTVRQASSACTNLDV